MFTRLGQWQRRNSSLITGLLMAYLWTCLGIATDSTLVKMGLIPIAVWKLIDTLNARGAKKDKDAMPHVGGGITSSVSASVHKEEVIVG